MNNFFSHHEFWTILHGMVLGGLYLVAFAGAIEGLWSLKPGLLTADGLRRSVRRLRIGLWTMAAVSWMTVLTGTHVVYHWYRMKIPESPRSRLLADPAKAFWHTFGMEWKEHLSWMAPILTTAAAFIVSRYGPELANNVALRRAVVWIFLLGFATAAIAGLLGAFINKIAPFIQG